MVDLLSSLDKKPTPEELRIRRLKRLKDSSDLLSEGFKTWGKVIDAHYTSEEAGTAIILDEYHENAFNDAFRKIERIASVVPLAKLSKMGRFPGAENLQTSTEKLDALGRWYAFLADAIAHEIEELAIKPALASALVQNRQRSNPWSRNKIIISGLLAILTLVAVYSFHEEENPPLTWTLLLCGMWSAGVWLWFERKNQSPSQ